MCWYLRPTAGAEASNNGVAGPRNGVAAQLDPVVAASCTCCFNAGSLIADMMLSALPRSAPVCPGPNNKRAISSHSSDNSSAFFLLASLAYKPSSGDHNMFLALASALITTCLCTPLYGLPRGIMC